MINKIVQHCFMLSGKHGSIMVSVTDPGLSGRHSGHYVVCLCKSCHSPGEFHQPSGNGYGQFNAY